MLSELKMHEVEPTFSVINQQTTSKTFLLISLVKGRSELSHQFFNPKFAEEFLNLPFTYGQIKNQGLQQHKSMLTQDSKTSKQYQVFVLFLLKASWKLFLLEN